MKNLTSELKNESIDKWEEIIALLRSKKPWQKVIKYPHTYRKVGYEKVYWDGCGFCEAANIAHYEEEVCENCELLLVGDHDGIAICFSDAIAEDETHAYLTLVEADNGNYTKALYHARIVLKAIKAVEIDKNAVE